MADIVSSSSLVGSTSKSEGDDDSKLERTISRASTIKLDSISSSDYIYTESSIEDGKLSGCKRRREEKEEVKFEADDEKFRDAKDDGKIVDAKDDGKIKDELMHLLKAKLEEAKTKNHGEDFAFALDYMEKIKEYADLVEEICTAARKNFNDQFITYKPSMPDFSGDPVERMKFADAVLKSNKGNVQVIISTIEASEIHPAYASGTRSGWEVIMNMLQWIVDHDCKGWCNVFMSISRRSAFIKFCARDSQKHMIWIFNRWEMSELTYVLDVICCVFSSCNEKYWKELLLAKKV